MSGKPRGKSGGKSGGKRPGTFASGADSRRGRGPRPGAPNAGRPPDYIREMAREGLPATLPGIIEIGKGSATTTVAGKDGEAVEVQPSFRDRIHAVRLLADVAGESRPADGGATVVELVVRYE